jgi:CubicO group peptidase (beta-lactamase class C family)
VNRSRHAVFVIAAALVALAACSDDPATGAVTSDPPVVDASEPSAPASTSGVEDTSSATTASSVAPRNPDTTTGSRGSTSTEATQRTFDFAAVSSALSEFVDERGLGGAGLVVVTRDEGVIHEEYLGEFSPDRISLVASSSKMITAGVLMHLHDAGLLDVDAPVADVVAWGSGNPGITPAQLVSNSSGLVGLLPEPAYLPYVCQFVPGASLQECAAQIFTTPDDDADIVPPDTEFRYGGAQWQVAGAVAEAASGRSWAELIDEIYVEPCGVDTLAYNNHWSTAAGFEYPASFDGDPSTLPPTANPNLEGGAYITPTDYAELLLMHLRGGRCGDVQVLSQESLDRMHADRTGAVYGSGTGYGMGWWIDRTTGLITDPGAYGAVPWLDLADEYGAYLVVEADGGTGGALAAQLFDLVDAAVGNGA